jgi:hypothetical protein
MIHHPFGAVRYGTILIGSPLSDVQTTAQRLGVIAMVVAAWAIIHLLRRGEDIVGAAPLLALLAFALLSAVVTCYYRMGMGTSQALSSRYSSMTMLGLVAVYALLIRFAIVERTAATLLAAAGMFVLLAGSAISIDLQFRRGSSGWDDGCALRTYAARYADVLSDDAVSQLWHHGDIVREEIPFLRAHGYSLFHRPDPVGLPARYDGSAAGCSIDAVNGRTGSTIDVHKSSDSGGVNVVGWAMDPATRQEPSRLFVSVDGRIDVPAFFGQARPASARFFGNAARGQPGFIGFVRTSLLTDGDHTLELKVVSHDGASYRTCGTARLRVAE